MSKSAFTSRRLLERPGLAVLGLGISGAAYATLIEPRWVLTTRQTHPIPGLSPALQGVTIAQLTDLHLGLTSREHLERCVEETNDLAPDLVALTGDYIGHHGGSEDAEIAGLLGRLEAPLGVYAVSGNHDHGVYRRNSRARPPRVMELLAEEGIRVLDNRAIPFERDGVRSWLVGLGDLWAGQCLSKETLRELPKAEAKIVLNHNPDAAPAIAAEGVDLVLAGHTHGGQVDLPLIGPPILPVQIREYYSGLYRVGLRTRLYVSNGLGWLIRVRLGARPEIALHKLSDDPT